MGRLAGVLAAVAAAAAAVYAGFTDCLGIGLLLFTDIAEKALARFEIYPARARAMALRGRCLYLHYPELGILYLRHDAGLHPPGQPGLFHQSHHPRFLWWPDLPRTAAAGPETVRRRCRSRPGPGLLPVRRCPLAVVLHLPDLGDV